MSDVRLYACGAPGPGDAHCTDRPGHDYSCYDAGDDVSFNEPQMEDSDLMHECDDRRCDAWLAAHDAQVRAEERERIARALLGSDLSASERFIASDGYPSVGILTGEEIRDRAARIARGADQ